MGQSALESVMIAGGGTGGHLFPGIALAQELRRQHPNVNIHFVGTQRGIEVRAVPKAGFALHLLPVRALRGKGLVHLLVGLAALPYAFFCAYRLIRRLKPDVAIGVGGYAAGPAMLAARLAGVRCVILEQNAVAGITNRALGRVAHRVIAALPSKNFNPKKTLVLGNPVRADLLPVREQPYAMPSASTPLHLLVMGGSQGAHAINQAMLQAIPMLAKLDFPVVIQHQTGVKDAPALAAAYAAAGLASATATPFIDDMAQALQQAHLVLCRSGASTLAELTVCGRPSILVPYPSAADDHQTANARVLVDAHAAELVVQSQLSAALIVDKLKAYMATPQRLADMAQASRNLGKPSAVGDIATAVTQEVRHV